MLTTNQLLVYVIPILICIGLLLWVRIFCDKDTKFPTRGSVLLFSIVSLIPIVNLFEASALIAFYIIGRVNGNLTFKKNKFNEFWNK